MEDKEAIWEGFKRKIARDEIMTGTELCVLLEIDYEPIVAARRADGPDNMEFFLSESVGIGPVRQRLQELLNG